MPTQPTLVVSGGTQFQISVLTYGASTPANVVITVSAAATIGATDLTVTTTPTNTTLYEGLSFKIGTTPNQQWVVVDQTWTGTGALKVVPITKAIAAGTTANTYAGLPLIGLESANMQLQTETNQVVLMSNNGWKITDYSTGSFEFSGNLYIPTSSALAGGAKAVIDALLNKSNLYVERILPDGTYHAGVCVVSSCSDQTQGANYVTQSVTFTGSGKPTQVRLNAA